MRAVLLLLIVIGAGIATLRAADEIPGSAGKPAERVAYIPIAREIDELLERYVKRAIADARAAGIKRVVVHLTTDGGTLDGGRKIAADLLEAGHQGMRTIAFVDDHCYSAGAMIAYANDEIHLG